jgi:dihydroorotate dehydrogenase
LNLYRSLVWPLLTRLDPEAAHEHTLALLERVQGAAAGRALLRSVAGRVPRRPVEAFGLTFPNVLGVAAGFDKDARVARGLAALGFGHVEVGTLTPHPQPGNPKPRVFRLPADRALINRMGFPNGGVAAAVPRLAALASLPGRGFVLGVSLGKQKETPLAEAARDYAEGMRAVYPHADYLAVNVSSPNTPGLRELQGGRYLEKLLGALVEEGRTLAAGHAVPPRPLLVKIAPDLTSGELDEVLEAVTAAGVSGVIATNTTVAREGLADPRREETGGLSGRPMEERATEVIAAIHRRTGGRLPILGVGGLTDPDGARAKLDAGASLLQLYTGLVYEGPGVAGRILRGLE